jgi:hypothetical protein
MSSTTGTSYLSLLEVMLNQLQYERVSAVAGSHPRHRSNSYRLLRGSNVLGHLEGGFMGLPESVT